MKIFVLGYIYISAKNRFFLSLEIDLLAVILVVVLLRCLCFVTFN